MSIVFPFCYWRWLTCGTACPGAPASGWPAEWPLARAPRSKGLVQEVRHGPLMQTYVFHDASRTPPGSGPHDVEVAMRIAPDPVARTEARVAPLRQAFALQRQNADQAPVVLGDIDDVVGIHIE